MHDTNGHSVTAHLAARVAELQAALDHVTRELGEKWRPRLLELERDVDALLRIMQPRGARTPDAGDEEPI